MSRFMQQATVALVILLAAALTAAPTLAEKPSWANGGKHEEHGHHSEAKSGHGAHGFSEHQQHVVRDYYGAEIHDGRCPPGLAKKHNGCMPPGQARKWQIGQPLPHDVTTHDLPPKLAVEIGLPPPGYRYVRAASDILMIATGTNMVVSAIQDLGQQ